MVRHSDTSADVDDVQLQLLRQKSPPERVGLALRLSSDVIRASKRAIARAYPDFSPSEREHLFLELHYGRELAEAVRRWRNHGRQ